jgi:tight adherence protein C
MKIAILAGALLAVCCLVAYLESVYSTLRKLVSTVDLELRSNDLVNTPWVGRWIRLVSVYNTHPSLEQLKQSITEKLNLAGRPGGRVSAEEFLATVELLVLGLFLVVFLLIFLSSGDPVNGLIFGGILAVLAAFLPFMWLDSLVADRRTAMSRAFPYFMDLSVMSMDAGASFLESLSTYIAENENTALADEFAQTLSEINMGKSLSDAMIALRERIPTVMVQNALMAIVQGERMGTPMVKVMTEQAEAIRFVRSQNAERFAEEIKVRMQGPAMLLLFSVLILIMGPAAIDMAGSDFF